MSEKRQKIKALAERVYRVKKAKFQFLCPLCSSERFFRYHSSLQKRHYLQVFLSSILLMLIFYPLMQERVLVIPFLVWPAFECFIKINHRKEIPCPYCGFDMVWYRRDVRVAKEQVERFWASQKLVKKSEENEEILTPPVGQTVTESEIAPEL